MAAEYHVRIKKAYAAAVIEDLEKMDAIELFEPEGSDENAIPQWQQEEMRRRIVARQANPSLLLSKEEAEASIKAMGR